MMSTETKHVVFFQEDVHEKKAVQSDFFEIASSCKETDYSLNPLHKKVKIFAHQPFVKK